MKVYLWLY